jgi:hypothetical protein
MTFKLILHCLTCERALKDEFFKAKFKPSFFLNLDARESGSEPLQQRGCQCGQ